MLNSKMSNSWQSQLPVWVTFYDIEKCFDSLWLQDCIDSLWENGIKDDILSLSYFLNTKANIVVKSPFGVTKQFICSSIVKQGTVLRPVLNNCSLEVLVIFLDQLKLNRSNRQNRLTFVYICYHPFQII